MFIQKSWGPPVELRRQQVSWPGLVREQSVEESPELGRGGWAGSTPVAAWTSYGLRCTRNKCKVPDLPAYPSVAWHCLFPRPLHRLWPSPGAEHTRRVLLLCGDVCLSASPAWSFSPLSSVTAQWGPPHLKSCPEPQMSASPSLWVQSLLVTLHCLNSKMI